MSSVIALTGQNVVTDELSGQHCDSIKSRVYSENMMQSIRITFPRLLDVEA